ncbi:MULTISPECIES: aminotransferase class V-fold PLP-dependent enzyme [unclassified Shewanella]|uniref:aminotransferase class V-fold PLP-dependent enzyme n=1 Tax=unclassified Shewanella TaxID=196818 RepID=UPI000C7B2748|nr:MULTISPECIES: aminotransferase class V-fold PLP-dependent enzyme [unclassified Shewanella]PKG55464.1 aminotransferase [Shewanella sp. GutDb-MelDb]PKG75365.1 aminotransferase [Shewanella sp. GutCb]
MGDFNHDYKKDFMLAPGSYLLNHSVGRPLQTAEADFKQQFFTPWQESGIEPWRDWLGIIERFTDGLSRMFNAPASEFCPQVNLSSALTKLVMSVDSLQRDDTVILMSEIDFPSMGFALKKALPKNCELRFIPKALDITDANVWDAHLTTDIDMVFVSHAYSNTGQLSPVDDIVAAAKSRGVLTLIDIAQSAGVVPVDLGALQADFMIGSSVKWLCGGPGAAYLWVNRQHIADCQPKDVGWFSHENPFEFDIHDFRYHKSALKFWGGTPSVAPYAIAAHSIDYFCQLGSEKLRQHNQHLIELVANELGSELVSPREQDKRSGTMILNFGHRQQQILSALKSANISVDARSQGIRVSPHIYNDEADMWRLLELVGTTGW